MPTHDEISKRLFDNGDYSTLPAQHKAIVDTIFRGGVPHYITREKYKTGHPGVPLPPDTAIPTFVEWHGREPTLSERAEMTRGIIPECDLERAELFDEHMADLQRGTNRRDGETKWDHVERELEAEGKADAEASRVATLRAFGEKMADMRRPNYGEADHHRYPPATPADLVRVRRDEEKSGNHSRPKG